MKHTNLIAAHMILAAALVLVPSASFAQKGKIVKNVVKSATGKAPVTLAEGASNAGRNLKAGLSSTSVVENMGRGIISVPGTPTNPAVNTPSINVPAIESNPGPETLNTTRPTPSVPLVSTPLVDRKIMEAGRASNPEFEIREGGLPRGSTEFTLPTATAGSGRKPPVTPTVLSAEMPEIPGGNGASATPDMGPQIKIIPLKTEDEVLILPTDMQNLIKTMTQDAMKRFGKNLYGEDVAFVQTLFKGVPTYSRLATANYLQTLGVNAETIVKAAGQFPSILKEYLPRVADSEPLLSYLYQNKRYTDETLPIILEHAQPEQINKFLASSIWSQKFEQADDLIAHYGADINEAFQQIFDKTFFNDKDLFAALQFFADRQVDFNQVFNKEKYPTAPTAAHQIAYRGDFAVVPFLKEHDVDLNAQDANGDTPLHIAVKTPVESGFMAFEKLLQAGADPTIKNNAGLDVMQQIQAELSDPSLSVVRKQDLKQMRDMLKPYLVQQNVPQNKDVFRHPTHF